MGVGATALQAFTDVSLSVFTADLLMTLLAEIVAVYPQERPMFYTSNDGQYGVLIGAY